MIPSLGSTVVRVILILVLYGGLAVVNVRGVRSGIGVVEILTAAKLLPLLLLVLVGVFVIHPANLAWTAAPELANTGSASLLLIFAFTGVEGALTSSGEVRDPARTVPRAILIGLGTVSLLYIAIQLVAQGVLGPELARNQTAPLVEVAGRVFGPGGRILLGVGAAISAFGYVSGDILATPRLLFAFARDRFLPQRFGRVNDRYHTPATAIVVHATFACALAISGTFTSLVVLSTVAILLVYLGTCLSSVQLSRRNVQADGPPFRIPGGPTVPLLACVVVVWMLTSASRTEFISVGATLCVASGLYLFRLISIRGS
jgi:amino acid transporter